MIPGILDTRTLPATPVSVATRRERLLFAVAERERTIFLPELAVADLSGCDVAWFDPSVEPAGRWADRLCAFRPAILVTCWSSPPFPGQADEYPYIKYICHLAGSVRRVAPRAFLEHGGLVSNWGDAVCAQVAEHALLLALLALRNGNGWRPYIRDQAASRANPALVLRTRTLFGRKVGLHGFGRIARTLVGLLKPFGVEIAACSEGAPHEFMRAHGAQPCASLHELFARSDVLFECEALTPETTLSVTAETLAALPDDAVFVNVGRGLVVDEAALAREAASGRIRIALDVVHEEPMTPASAIFAHETALFSPHIAGPTADRYRHCGQFALENIARYLSGQPVQARVTLADYDRST